MATVRQCHIDGRARACSTCQIHQDTPASAPLHPWSFPETPWYRVHVDFAELHGNHLTDAHSKWLEAVDMATSTNAASTIRVLRNIFATHGLPVQLVSDNGPPFSSAEFEAFMKQNGIHHIYAYTAFPPFFKWCCGESSANGKIGSTKRSAYNTSASQTGELFADLSNHTSFYYGTVP